MDQGTIAHPLVDAVGTGFVVTESDARVVDLSSARSGLLRETASAGLATVLLTPATSRVTVALLTALRGAGGTWVVRVGEAYRAVDSDTVAGTVGEAWIAEPAPVRRVLPAPDEVPWTECSVSVLHRATEGAVLGRVTEELLEALAGVAPAAWGLVEPASLSWDTAALTAAARRRAPAPTHLQAVAVVPGGTASIRIRVARTDQGVLEETRLALPRDVLVSPNAAVDPDATVDPDAVVDPDTAVVAVFRDLARRHRVLLATAWRTAGHPDATLGARPRVLPVPLGAVVGARAVRDLGVDPRSVVGDGIETVGPSRVPSFVLDTGVAAAVDEATDVEAGPDGSTASAALTGSTGSAGSASSSGTAGSAADALGARPMEAQARWARFHGFLTRLGPLAPGLLDGQDPTGAPRGGDGAEDRS
jgi:hypothetical protein